MDVVEDEVQILFRDPEFSLSAPRQSHKSPSYTERMHPEPSVERNALNSYSQTASLFISCDTHKEMLRLINLIKRTWKPLCYAAVLE